ncbi:hypothetical protein [Pseudoalteromonas phage H105/1]|uniref:hypothetical protein n=1 Tax=Pseudoalteromonas phage H105/1 TaxID=877240 RepID=UPI0001E439D3|nr:hypothetical protein AV949_gp16 [Pseudoalteromonas phage H105/1]ADM26676.1 hypothetical protein [Pseudoalteromonas phage H105/1]
MSGQDKTLVSLCIALSFIFGLLAGAVIYDLGFDNSALKARCESVNGSYGGRKCYKKGVEIND